MMSPDQSNLDPMFNPSNNQIKEGVNLNLPSHELVNKILRGERSAVEAYQQVIEKFSSENEFAIEPLKKIMSEHEDACGRLAELIREEKEEPSHDSGVWGGFVKAYVTTAKLLGANGALHALKTGEEHGLHQYEDAMDLELTSHEKDVISNVLLVKQRAHVMQLDRLISEYSH